MIQKFICEETTRIYIFTTQFDNTAFLIIYIPIFINDTSILDIGITFKI